jgi:putative FmdB family regulatory protein
MPDWGGNQARGNHESGRVGLLPLIFWLKGCVWAAGGFLSPGRAGSFEEGYRMPTYDYVCNKCEHTFQRIEKISEHGQKKTKCPECKSTRVEQVFTSVFVKTSKKS